MASGTSSKQIDKETDVRFVGYFGAVGEGLLALGTIIATTAGFKTLANWEEIYAEWNAGGVNAFVQGGGALMNEGLGIPTSLSATILATMAVLFAATTMDSGVRLQRIVVQEIGEIMGIRITALVSTIIAVGLAFGLTFSAGADGSGGMTIWPLFGTTNQLMAGLSLAIVVVILTHLRRPTWPVVFPLIFVTAMSLWAALLQLKSLFTSQNWLLFCMDVVIVAARRPHWSGPMMTLTPHCPSMLDKLKALAAGLNEYYQAPYRASFAKAQQQEDDLFMMLVVSEALGIPNPASYYTLELLPLVYEDFHAWHTRMGMERSPLENIQCC